MDPQRSGALLAGSCFALVGCAAQGHGWAYNSCGDPSATEIASLDGGPGAGPGAGSAHIDTNTLLYEMTALGALARRPPSYFRTCMVSSYDRHSTVPQASSDTPTGWFANHDWGNYVGQETGPAGESEFVLLDADGPGAVVRIWSPSRDGKPNGTLRIYVDRGVTPTLEAPMVSLLAGQIAPFSSPFAGTTAKGGNLEFPLPFREHVKVTWDGTAGYYQVTFRKYAEPAPDVTSFDLAAVDLGLLDLVRLQLQRPTLANSATISSQSVLSASSPELAIAASPGGEEILALQISTNLVDVASLRSSVLSLRFDGQETVRVPLGDFFGAGPGLLPHSTLPLDVGPDGVFTARFVMSFAQSAVVRVDGAAGLEATVTVLHEAAPFDSSTYYFHAHWSARGPMAARPYRDLLLADVTGEGAYVGTFLAVGNSSTAWWGEGDEKVWVDSEAFPSLFGTGTEDYFGQGYCSPETYNHPYRAQALASGDSGSADGLFSMVRTHVLDPIRFATSLKFNLELWHWDEDAQVTFDTVTYFYLAQDATDNLPMPTAADFRLSPFGQ